MTYSCLPRRVGKSYNLYMRVEEMVACNSASFDAWRWRHMNRVRNSKCAMHNVHLTASCKPPSHTPSKVFYWLDEVNRSIAWQRLPIEGLHDAVRTYTHTILSCPMVSFLYHEVSRKTTKKPFYFWVPSWHELKYQPSVCTIILVTLM